MTEPGNALLVEPDAAALRTAMGRFPTGVTLLTQGCGHAALALTVNSLVSVSLDPLLILVSVKRSGRMRPGVVRAGSFAVNILTQAHRDLCAEFARPDRPEGMRVMRRTGAVEGFTGNSVMPSAAAALECVLHAEVPAGDHVLLVGRVTVIHPGAPDTRPLVFHQGSFSGLSPIEEVS
ncbi:flavin reductase family protein [Streptomyces sp. OR43]|uniref:flavin reductase family protein n=1 Tax=Streptomyces sp. or43 TaxID=2478957 RepID=UPI0011CE736A|nr:flavin reductase family protein [Streptomyces sp. or43]TXS39169.1 flavin reductase [Streptomyces sp. or43]